WKKLARELRLSPGEVFDRLDFRESRQLEQCSANSNAIFPISQRIPTGIRLALAVTNRITPKSQTK
ncbi:MAG: hypothetical protein ABI615_08700, partial [Chthoniobacterales bacterium]